MCEDGCGCGKQNPIYETPDTLGGFWGDLLGQGVGAGVSTGLQILAGSGGGGGQQGVCGQSMLADDGQIAACLDRMLTELGAVTANATTAEKLAAYEQFLAFMQSPQFFNQAASPHYLGNQIRLFPGYIAEFRRQLAAEIASGATTVVTDPATGQPIAVSNTDAGGIDTTTLLLIGGGALALILLTKN